MIHHMKNKSILFIYSEGFLFFEWKLEKSDLKWESIVRSPEFKVLNAEENSFLELRVGVMGYPEVYLYGPENLVNGYYILTTLNKNRSLIRCATGTTRRSGRFYSFSSFELSAIKEYPIIITGTAKLFTNEQFSVSDVDYKERMREFSTDWTKILELSHNTDIELTTDGESIKVHRIVLQTRSPVFRKMFEQDLSEASENVVVISDIGSATMKRLVNFLYTGIMDDCEFDEALELYYAADKYEVLSLREDCKIELLNHLDESNACRLFTLASRHNDEDFKEKVVKFTSGNLEQVINTESMKEMSKEDAISLMRLSMKKQ